MPNKLLIVDLFMTSIAELNAVLPFIIMRPLCQSFIQVIMSQIIDSLSPRILLLGEY